MQDTAVFLDFLRFNDMSLKLLEPLTKDIFCYCGNFQRNRNKLG